MSASDLDDSDIVLWSEEQAAPLRRVAATRPNEPALDWEHIIDGMPAQALPRTPSLTLDALLADEYPHVARSNDAE